ncbi:MAG: hypothetical protein ACRD2G_09985, partial [Terriglobia bacterium]
MLLQPERASSDRQTTFPQLFQKLEFFGKGKRAEPLAGRAFTFQDLTHPLAHEPPRRNLTP